LHAAVIKYPPVFLFLDKLLTCKLIKEKYRALEPVAGGGQLNSVSFKQANGILNVLYFRGIKPRAITGATILLDLSTKRQLWNYMKAFPFVMDSNLQ